MRGILSLVCLLMCFLLPGRLNAQATPSPPPVPTANPASQSTTADSNTPVEYEAGEFRPWMLDLRRGEILFFGALPVTFFIANEIIDCYRFTRYSIQSGSLLPDYAPWPGGGLNKPPYTSGEKTAIILSTVSLALIVSVTDYFIGRRQGRNLAGGS